MEKGKGKLIEESPLKRRSREEMQRNPNACETAPHDLIANANDDSHSDAERERLKKAKAAAAAVRERRRSRHDVVPPVFNETFMQSQILPSPDIPRTTEPAELLPEAQSRRLESPSLPRGGGTSPMERVSRATEGVSNEAYQTAEMGRDESFQRRFSRQRAREVAKSYESMRPKIDAPRTQQLSKVTTNVEDTHEEEPRTGGARKETPQAITITKDTEGKSSDSTSSTGSSGGNDRSDDECYKVTGSVFQRISRERNRDFAFPRRSPRFQNKSNPTENYEGGLMSLTTRIPRAKRPNAIEIVTNERAAQVLVTEQQSDMVIRGGNIELPVTTEERLEAVSKIVTTEEQLETVGRIVTREEQLGRIVTTGEQLVIQETVVQQLKMIVKETMDMIEQQLQMVEIYYRLGMANMIKEELELVKTEIMNEQMQMRDRLLGPLKTVNRTDAVEVPARRTRRTDAVEMRPVTEENSEMVPRSTAVEEVADTRGKSKMVTRRDLVQLLATANQSNMMISNDLSVEEVITQGQREVGETSNARTNRPTTSATESTTMDVTPEPPPPPFGSSPPTIEIVENLETTELASLPRMSARRQRINQAIRLPRGAGTSAADFYETDSLAVTVLPVENKVGLVYDERMCAHKDEEEEDHVEGPARILAISGYLLMKTIDKKCERVAAREATIAELSYVHTEDYITTIEAVSRSWKDPASRAGITKKYRKPSSVYFNEHTAQTARMAAGSCVELALQVARGRLTSGAAVVRPPGHHAEKDKPMGFCFFNNVAIAVHEVLYGRQGCEYSIENVLIVDWDVHHGNGIQKMFWDDDNVLYFSIHRYDNGKFYPKSTHANLDQVGGGKGKGFNVNVPWEGSGYGDVDYLAVFDQLLAPIAKQFHPDMVFIAGGFDSAVGDRMGGCNVTPAGYFHMTKKLIGLARHGRVVLILEGGYNLEATAESFLACMNALLDHDNKFDCPDVSGQLHEKTRSVIKRVAKSLRPFWSSLPDPEEEAPGPSATRQPPIPRKNK